MTEQNQTPSPPSEITSEVSHGTPLSAPDATAQSGQAPLTQPGRVIGPKIGLEKIKPILINLFNKFYSNKKIFWPVSIAIGLIFLIIILGLIFGKRTVNTSTSKTPSPIPFVQITPVASTSGDILTTSGAKLESLKNDINNLDIEESRLKPPTLNFEIKF